MGAIEPTAVPPWSTHVGWHGNRGPARPRTHCWTWPIEGSSRAFQLQCRCFPPTHTHPPLLEGQSGNCRLASCSQPAPGIRIQEHSGPPSPLVRGRTCSHGNKESIPLLNLVTSLWWCGELRWRPRAWTFGCPPRAEHKQANTPGSLVCVWSHFSVFMPLSPSCCQHCS